MILDWKKFVLRSDIKNLPLEEQRRKFLEEQLYHDNLLSEQIQRQKQYEFYMSQMQPKGGASGGGFSGQAIDGPISGATVTSNVGTTTTNALGEFTLPSRPTGPITITGGTDSITGVAFEGELIGYAEYKTISPITTVAHYIKEEGSLTIDEAVTKVFASSSALFGIELPVDSKDVVLQRDYIKESVVNNNRVGIAAQAVATYLEGITETLGETLIRNSGNLNEKNQFIDGKGKNKSYRAIGRQIALDNRLDPSTLNKRIILTDKNKEIEGREISNYSTISSQLNTLKNNLRSKVDEQQYTANYLTTQIQAFNRAQKTTIKQEIADAINTVDYGFTNIEEAKENVADDLKQIEAGKTNETDAVVDSRLTSYGAPEGAFSQKSPKGLRVKFEAGVFNDLTAVRSVVYFGSSLLGSTLYKTVESKLGVGYQTILMRVGEEDSVTTTSISTNEYVEIEVTDENKNPFLITAKPQPLLEKPTAATLTAVSIAKGQKQPKDEVDHISGEGTYTITSGPSELNVDRTTNLDSGKFELHWAEKAGSFILRETKEEGIFEVGVKGAPTILATKLTFEDDAMSFSIPDEEVLDGKRTYNVSYSAESDDNSSDVDHIQNSKSVQYSIAELVDGSYTKDTTDGVSRGGTDMSGLAKLEITYSPFLFSITENYTQVKGENAVGLEVFTVTDISKEGGLGQLVNNATFVKDEGSTTERLIFSFNDIKGTKRTFRITYTVL